MNKSFTLIELLVVISILGLLSSLVLISLQGAKDQADIGKAQEFSHTVRVSLGADLVGEWRLNDGAGNSSVDSSGYGNDGNWSGAGVGGTHWTTDGIHDGAALFNGTDDYIEVAHSSAFDVSQLTIELWIKTPANFGGNRYRALVSKQGADRDYNWYTRSNDNPTRVTDLHFSSARWGSSLFSLPSPYEPETWHHVAITVDSTGLQKYYSDGVLFDQSQKVPAIADNNYPLWIGRADNLWNGIIDDLRIYNKALSSAEIQQHYVREEIKYNIVLK